MIILRRMNNLGGHSTPPQNNIFKMNTAPFTPCEVRQLRTVESLILRQPQYTYRLHIHVDFRVLSTGMLFEQVSVYSCTDSR